MLRVQLKPLLQRLNKSMKSALEGAAGLCVQTANYEVTLEHLLLKLCEDPKGDIQEILRHFEVEPAQFIKALQRVIESLRTGNAGKPVFSPLLTDMLQEAWLISSVELGQTRVRSGALMLALAINPSRTNLEDFTDAFNSISAEALRKDFQFIVTGTTEDEPAEPEGFGAAAAGEATPGAGKVHGRDPESALAKYTEDFTAKARAGLIDPVFEREREIRQVIDILARRRKNNPIIVGEPGTGKSALVEGLALRIAANDVPKILQGNDLLSLDMGLLQAGASMKGEFENRLKGVLNEVKASPKPIVLFIDEAHTMIGAGGSQGGSDAANLLKPALARGELRTIAATTWSEYKKYFEKDAALSRRFQVVKCDEPSEDAATAMLRGLRSRYESSHQVHIREDAIVAAAKLSNRYISGRLLPDKAVDLIDTASARVKVSLTAKPDELDDTERRIVAIDREIESLERDQASGKPIDPERLVELAVIKADHVAKANELRERWLAEKELADRVLELSGKLYGKPGEDKDANAAEEPAAEGEGAEGEVGDGAEAKAEDSPPEAEAPTDEDPEAMRAELEEKLAALKELQGKDPLLHVDVNPDVIGKVVSDWTGIPVGNMVRDEAKAVLELEETLKRRIKGQDHALAAVAKGLRAAKAGVGNPDTPMGVFLFVGPSGVGKTETALAIAEQLFGGERFIVTINMSEFQEKHTVSRLVGSPPGYVGYGEGGVLTEAVRQRPYSVVLLDECEKADPDVLNIFYQVFDKGMLADGEGRVIDFKNTVIFLTSNLATEEIMALAGGPTPISAEDLTHQIRPILSAHFKPALLARMGIVPYFPLAGEAMTSIVELKLRGVGKRLLRSHKMGFSFDPEVVDQIADRCTEVETGARNIDHIINGTLLPLISTAILEKMAEETSPDHLNIGWDEAGEFTLTFTEGEQQAETGAAPEAEVTADV